MNDEGYNRLMEEKRQDEIELEELRNYL